MFPSQRACRLAACGPALLPGLAQAHSFGTIYTPPIPFQLYFWGAAGALLASFLLFGVFLRNPAPLAPQDKAQTGSTQPGAAVQICLLILRLFVLGLLLLCIATGIWGNPSPYGNFNMTFFWIVFALGGLYLAALIGDYYALLNPWKTLSAGVGRLWPSFLHGRLTYPKQLSDWPALLLYAAFIWTELFGGTRPHSLALLLTAYTGLNLAGVFVFGQRAWFRHGEFFSVMFRLIGHLSPLAWRTAPHPGIRLRWPLNAAADMPASSMSLLLFILFMLSSTAFDGLKETLLWQRLFWVDLYHAGLKHYAGVNPLAAVPQMRIWAQWWHSSWLLLSPLLYLLLYWLFIWLGKLLSGSSRATHQLAMDFALSLLPIALVYHLSHYYTLIQTQGVKVVKLASDPFGWGWDLFGTARWMQRTIIPDQNIVWHVQVVLIVLGHIGSVYLAHRVALRVFPSHRQAVLSQIPMLALMLIFTTAGLWVLSLPLARTS